MVPVLDQHHCLSTVAFGKVDQVEEGALVELVNGDVSKPDEESLLGFFQEAREVRVAVRSIQTNHCLKIEEPKAFSVEFHKFHKLGAGSYSLL